MAFEVLGISPMGSSMVPAEDGKKGQVAEECGRLVLDVLERDLRPSQIITKESLENAIAAGAMSGGSTNVVLHLLAVANEAGRAARRSTTSTGSPGARRCSRDLKPGRALRGDRPLPRRRRAARDPAASRRPACCTRTRSRSPARRSARWPTPPRRPRARRWSGRWTTRSSRTAASRSCAATSRPRAAWSSSPATGAREHRGPARVFESRGGRVRGGQGEVDPARRGGRDPQRGPRRRPGHARDAARDRGARGRGPRRLGRAAHRRALLRRHPRLHGRPRGARGAARRADRRGARRRHDRLRRRRAASSTWS